MKLIALGGKNGVGRFAKVSDQRFEELSRFKWCAHIGRNGTWYAVRRRTNAEGGGILSMHRQIMVAKSGEWVDHKNHDGLDNQDANLRKCSNQENITNQKLHRDSKSGFKGVSWHRARKKW